jgi:subtilisin family serine protease
VPNNIETTIFKHGYDTGARIHTNSWGSNTPTYTPTARDADVFMDKHRDFVVLVAAGNSGRDGLFSVGSPASAKNVISVGASQNAGTPQRGDLDPTTIASFSSIGPVATGQIGLHVTAPGAGERAVVASFCAAAVMMTGICLGNACSCHVEIILRARCAAARLAGSAVVSASSNTQCGTVDLQGTSMATPLVAGTVALARQYYMEGKSPYAKFTPSGAMLKATVIHSGVAMTGLSNFGGVDANGDPLDPPVTTLNDPSYSLQPPSVVQGYGRVDISTVFPFQSEFVFWAKDELKDGEAATIGATGAAQEWEVSVLSAGQPLKATLVWTDPPAALNARNALINDLDLVLIDPAGNTVLPTTINLGGGENAPPNLGGPVQRVDSENNIEQVTAGR